MGGDQKTDQHRGYSSICYRPSHQQDKADKAFLRQVEKASHPRRWYSWVALTTAISTGRLIWLDTSNPDFWNSLKTVS